MVFSYRKGLKMKNRHPHWIIEALPASKNLNCPALRIGNWFYIDYFNSWGTRGFFLRIGCFTRYFKVPDWPCVHGSK